MNIKTPTGHRPWPREPARDGMNLFLPHPEKEASAASAADYERPIRGHRRSTGAIPSNTRRGFACPNFVRIDFVGGILNYEKMNSHKFSWIFFWYRREASRKVKYIGKPEKSGNFLKIGNWRQDSHLFGTQLRTSGEQWPEPWVKWENTKKKQLTQYPDALFRNVFRSARGPLLGLSGMTVPWSTIKEGGCCSGLKLIFHHFP